MKSLAKAVGWVIFYFLFQFAVLLAVLFVYVRSSDFSSAELASQMGTEFISDNQLGIYLLINLLFIAVVRLIFRIRKRPFDDISGKTSPDISRVIKYSVGVFSFSAFFYLCTYSMQLEGVAAIERSRNYYSQYFNGLGWIVQVVMLLAVTPFAEELLNRGLVISELGDKFSNTVKIIISGIIFGFSHGAAGGLPMILGGTVIGALFAYIYIKTDSLITAAAVHSAANLPDFIYPLFNEYIIPYKTVIIICLLTVFLFSVLSEYVEYRKNIK
ncbi:MAG: CPBP family intramembrane metalloprotease [Oscillospiraceae bacterium]|nr:CPBP family intramembrane metalloprotease [Oscillospiraceae bacterium]